MYIHLPHNLPHYFQKKFSRQLKELYVSTAILDFALAAVVLYEPIYLYQRGFSISHLMMYYIIVYGLYFFLVPLGGKFVARFGAERSILVSSVMLIGYYGSLFLIQQFPVFFWVAPAFFALQKMWYWPAYHSDFIRSSDQGERGKEFSGLWSVSTLVYIIGPVVGGLLIKFFSFNGLFLVVGILILISNIPMFIERAPALKEKFSYWNSLSMPFRRTHVRSTLGYFALGEELVMMVVWPIYIALTFKDYLSIGGVVTGATLITVVMTLYFGRIIDHGKPRRLLRFGAVATSINWFARLFLKTGAVVFASEAAGRLVKNATFVPMTSITYEHALREERVIERSVFYEQGFAIGKTLMAAAVLILAHFMPSLSAAWILAGFASLMYLVF